MRRFGRLLLVVSVGIIGIIATVQGHECYQCNYPAQSGCSKWKDKYIAICGPEYGDTPWCLKSVTYTGGGKDNAITRSCSGGDLKSSTTDHCNVTEKHGARVTTCYCQGNKCNMSAKLAPNFTMPLSILITVISGFVFVQFV